MTSMWRDAVHDALTTATGATGATGVTGGVVLLLGPGGTGKTRFWERDLPSRGWDPTSHEDGDALSLSAWLARAGGTTFGFCGGLRPVAVVDDIDALSVSDRTALMSFVRERMKGGGRPVLLVGRAVGRDLSRLLVRATVRADHVNAATASTLLAPSYPRLTPSRVLACCKQVSQGDSTDDAVDLHRACALLAAESVTPGLGSLGGRVVSRARDESGCPDAARMFASVDALDPGVLEARVGGDATTAFSLAFENVDAILTRVVATGSSGRRRAVRDGLVRALASAEPFVSDVGLRPFLDTVLCATLRASLGDRPRRVRKAEGAPPWARAALWSRGACAAQASQRRAEIAAEAGISALDVRAREK